MARKHLRALCADKPHVEIEEVELLTSPGRILRDGIRMIPALKIGEEVLSGLHLSQQAIADFLGERDKPAP